MVKNNEEDLSKAVAESLEISLLRVPGLPQGLPQRGSLDVYILS